MDAIKNESKVLDFSGLEGLKAKKVAVVGLGGVGSIVAELLAREGIGKLILVDGDYVAESSIKRQILYGKGDVDMPKAIAAREHLYKINPFVEYELVARILDQRNISDILSDADIIVDCTDNMDTKYLLNDFALSRKLPFIHVAVASNMGVVFNIIPKMNTPCLQCLYPRSMVEQAGELAMMDTSGIPGSTILVVGAIATHEVMKLLLNSTIELELIYINMAKMEMQRISVEKDSKCPACAGRYESLSMKPERGRVWGKGKYCVLPARPVDFDGLVDFLSARGEKFKYNEHILHYTTRDGVKLSIFRDGHAIVLGAGSKERAVEIYDELFLQLTKLAQEDRQSSLFNNVDENAAGGGREEEKNPASDPRKSDESREEFEEKRDGSNILFPNPFN